MRFRAPYPQNKPFILSILSSWVAWWTFLSLFGIFCLNGCLPLGNQSYLQLEPEDIPTSPTYKGQVEEIVYTKCALCHSSKEGKTFEGIDYKDYQSLRNGWDPFKQTSIIDKSMPPGGKERFTPKEIAILERWAEQGFLEK